MLMRGKVKKIKKKKSPENVHWVSEMDVWKDFKESCVAVVMETEAEVKCYGEQAGHEERRTVDRR